MSKEINYPIKYAVLELKKRGGWSVGYEDITQGFIVSKCYVMESNIVYHSDGSNEIVHKVVFPFENISCFEVNDKQILGNENIPYYDTCNNPRPVNVVTNLFDSYEEGKIVAEERNEKLKKNLILEVEILKPDWKETLEKLEQKFDKRLELCYLFEQLVLEKTGDMKISKQLSTSGQKNFVKILEPIRKQV